MCFGISQEKGCRSINNNATHKTEGRAAVLEWKWREGSHILYLIYNHSSDGGRIVKRTIKRIMLLHLKLRIFHFGSKDTKSSPIPMGAAWTLSCGIFYVLYLYGHFPVNVDHSKHLYATGFAFTHSPTYIHWWLLCGVPLNAHQSHTYGVSGVKHIFSILCAM